MKSRTVPGGDPSFDKTAAAFKGIIAFAEYLINLGLPYRLRGSTEGGAIARATGSGLLSRSTVVPQPAIRAMIPRYATSGSGKKALGQRMFACITGGVLLPVTVADRLSELIDRHCVQGATVIAGDHIEIL
jgi:hypothetical protein